MIIDTILRYFSLIVFIIIVVIVTIGGLKLGAKGFARDPWGLSKGMFIGTLIWVLISGATTGFFFISPTDTWVEIIVGVLAISLTITVCQGMVYEFINWRKKYGEK